MMGEDVQSLGIFYHYDDIDVRKGTGLILGPEDTPYADCPLVFSVTLPMDYPFQSPAVTILTSDSRTRFHPNLYVEGKVCLSILGTFSGPKWVSTMSIETVFKSIHSLLNDNPIVNEPGWEKYTLSDPKASNYAEWVAHNLMIHTIQMIRLFLMDPKGHLWTPFEDVLMPRLPGIVERLLKRARSAAEKGEKTYVGIPYSMGGTTRWGTAVNQLQDLLARARQKVEVDSASG